MPLPGLRGGGGFNQHLASSFVQIQDALLLTLVSFSDLVSTVRSDQIGRSSYFLQTSLSTAVERKRFCLMALCSSDV